MRLPARGQPARTPQEVLGHNPNSRPCIRRIGDCVPRFDAGMEDSTPSPSTVGAPSPPRRGSLDSPVPLLDLRAPSLRRTAKCQNKGEVRFDQTPAARHANLRQKTRRKPAVALTVERERAEKRGVLQCRTRPSHPPTPAALRSALPLRGARASHASRPVSPSWPCPASSRTIFSSELQRSRFRVKSL